MQVSALSQPSGECRLPPGWTLVTDDSADSASLAPFRAHDADVIVVDAEGIAMVQV